MRTSPRLIALQLALCLLGLGGCGGSGDTAAPPVANPPVASADRFWIEPTKNVTIARGQAVGLYAALQKPTDIYPQYQSGMQVVWNSGDSSVALIDSDGVLTGLTEGVTKVTATHGTHRASVEVTVNGTMQSRTILVSGQSARRYSLYLPSALTPATVSALLVSAHGGGGTAMIQASTSQLNSLAHAQNFRVVYLEGSGAIQTFNAGACCGFAQAHTIDDVAYVRAVLDDVQSRVSIDATKIFATGFSNGAMLSHRLACALSDRISGVAAIGGASGQFDFDRNRYYDCNPSRPIPILHIHATNDRNYPFVGSFGDGTSDTNYYSVEATINDWIARNNVSPNATLEQVTPSTTCSHYRDNFDSSKQSAPVTLCTVAPTDVYDPTTQIVFGGGHSWPGGARSPSPTSDTPPSDFAANDYLWSFLNR